MIKLVVFDIDGTLADSDEGLCRAFQNTFSHFKLKPPSREQVLLFVGNAEEKWLELLLKETKQEENAPTINEMSEYFRGRYFAFYFPVIAHLNGGAIEVLTKLRENGIKTAIVTNGRRAYVERVTTFFKIKELLDETVSVDEVKEIKPSPEPLLHVVRDFRDNPKEVLFVGDTQIDAKTAENAGTHFALLVNARNKEVKAEHRISSLAELPKLVEEINSAKSETKAAD